jgi:hypothetical protein
LYLIPGKIILSKAEPFGENAHKMIIELEYKSGKTLFDRQRQNLTTPKTSFRL